MLFVRSTHRRSGIGRKLIACAVEELKTLRKVTLKSDFVTKLESSFECNASSWGQGNAGEVSSWPALLTVLVNTWTMHRNWQMYRNRSATVILPYPFSARLSSLRSRALQQHRGRWCIRSTRWVVPLSIPNYAWCVCVLSFPNPTVLRLRTLRHRADRPLPSVGPRAIQSDVCSRDEANVGPSRGMEGWSIAECGGIQIGRVFQCLEWPCATDKLIGLRLYGSWIL